VLFLLFGLSCWIVVRIYALQTEHNGYWKKLGEDLTQSMKEIKAERGNIYTHDGRILATTLPTFELRMDTRAQGLKDTIWNRHIDTLSLFLGEYLPEKSSIEWRAFLTHARDNNQRHLLLAKNVSFQNYKRIREIPIFKLGKNKSGFISIDNNTRKLPFGNLAKRTIGYTGDKAKGIEGYQDKYLAGENQLVLMQKVAGGIYMPVNENSEFGSKPGLDIYTTIDVNLQDIVQESLMKSVTKFKANHGSAILMSVKTGEIKAMANIGLSKNGEYGEIYNWAINERLEPGSVFKLASVMALIDNGYADINTQVNLENGQTKYSDRIMKDDHIVPGTVSLKRAFELSSNVGISKLVVQNFGKKKEEFYEFLEKIHLTESYGIDLSCEDQPILANPKDWNPVTLPWLSTGYEIRLTPLQTLGLYNAVANNGVLMKPFIVKEVRDNDKIIESYKPQILNKELCKPSTIAAVRAMLEGVVDSGTASGIKNDKYRIGGKTGTNQLVSGKKFSSENYQASFVGFYPADNPVYSCIVVINRPNKYIGYHGSECAAPVFKDVIDRLYATDISIHPNLEMDKNKTLFLPSFAGAKREIEKIANFFDWNLMKSSVHSDWAVATAVRHHLVMRPSFVQSKNRMPNVSQMSLKDAIYLLESMGLQVYVEGKGKVRNQSIRAGEVIYRGTQVKLYLS